MAGFRQVQKKLNGRFEGFLTCRNKLTESSAPLLQLRKVISSGVVIKQQKGDRRNHMKQEVREKVCWVVGAGSFDGLMGRPQKGDLVIAADGGYIYLKELGIEPDVLLGDFDSLKRVPEHGASAATLSDQR